MDALRSLLQSFQGEHVFYQYNPGNVGDALIAMGAYKLFAELDLSVHYLRPGEDPPPNRVLFYAGGGNLVPEYAACRSFLERWHRSAKHIVLLPHTIAGNEELLGSLGPNVTLVCREPVSLAHVRTHAPKAPALLSHDLAFLLDPREVMSRRTRVRPAIGDTVDPWAVPIGPWLASRRQVGSVRRRRSRLGAVLDAFRQDAEATIDPPRQNIDLSEELKVGVRTPGLARLSSRALFRSIEPFELIRTNRLHVAIAAGLLGKEVEFYSNSYFKNRAVFEHSIKDRLPTVRWMGLRPEEGTSGG